MNEHYDPSPSEVWAEARRYSVRAWLVATAIVLAGGAVLWPVIPELVVLAPFGLLFIFPFVRTVARVVFATLFVAAAVWWVAVTLAAKDGGLRVVERPAPGTTIGAVP